MPEMQPIFEVAALDVGHGNSTLIRSGELNILIDAPKTGVVAEELSRSASGCINHLILSHSDADHIGGTIGILSDDSLTVEQLWVNPDAIKKTSTWDDLRYMAFELCEKGRLHVSTGLNTEASPVVNSDQLSIEVLHPDIFYALGGPGSRLPGRRQELSANAMSVVLRVKWENDPVALIPGDLDQESLNRLIERRVDLSARVLIFPHHGGLSGSSTNEFSEALVQAVRPELIIFSYGRNRFRNPSLAVMEGIDRGAPNARVVCTQLSARCCSDHDEPPRSAIGYCRSRPGVGVRTGWACGGTVVVGIDGSSLRIAPSVEDHSTFVKTYVEGALCRRRLPEDTDIQDFGGA